MMKLSEIGRIYGEHTGSWLLITSMIQREFMRCLSNENYRGFYAEQRNGKFRLPVAEDFPLRDLMLDLDGFSLLHGWMKINVDTLK